MRSNKTPRGSALPLVIILTSVLSVLAAGILTISTQDKQNTAGEINMTRALYLADGGVELALDRLRYFVWQDFQVHIDHQQTIAVWRDTAEPNYNSQDTWHINAEGQIKDLEGRLLAKKLLQATIKKSYCPEQFSTGLPTGSSLYLSALEEQTKQVYYADGDLNLSGTGSFHGQHLIAARGKVTIQGNLQPADEQSTLVIVSSRQVELGNGAKVWASLFAPTLRGGKNSTLYGQYVGGTLINAQGFNILESGQIQIAEQTTILIEEYIALCQAFAQENAPPKPVLVKWRERYSVF